MKKLILLFAVAVAFVSCQKLNGPQASKDRLKAILLGKDTLDLYVGEIRQVPITISPSNYNTDSIKWKSSDSTVISISTSGLLTAKKVGSSTITISNLTSTISVNCLITVVPAPVDSLKVGLIAYYPFNNSAADSSGNGYNGITNNVSPTTDRNGKENGAYYFDGATSYVTVKDAPALRLSNIDFTINSWVNITAYNSDYGSIIIDKRGAGLSNGWNFGIAGYGDLTNAVHAYGVVTYAASGGTDPYIAGRMKVDSSQWHMVTVSYSVSNSEASIYVDGQLDNIAYNILMPNPNNNADVFIGKDNPVAFNGYYFSGKINDIRIYSRMLKPSEIKKLFTISN